MNKPVRGLLPRISAIDTKALLIAEFLLRECDSRNRKGRFAGEFCYRAIAHREDYGTYLLHPLPTILAVLWLGWTDPSCSLAGDARTQRIGRCDRRLFQSA